MTKDLDKLTFEEALAELEKIVRQLEGGQGDLKASIEAFERGTALKTLCEGKLREAEARIEKISLGADGKPVKEAFQLSE